MFPEKLPGWSTSCFGRTCYLFSEVLDFCSRTSYSFQRHLLEKGSLFRRRMARCNDIGSNQTARQTMTADAYEKLPPEEKEHFAECTECGEIFDRRSLDELVIQLRSSARSHRGQSDTKNPQGVEPCGSLLVPPFRALASHSGWMLNPPYASSASRARRLSRLKNAWDWPLNSPSSVRALTAPLAAPFVSVGRIIEHLGKVLLRNGHGSGIIRFACNVSG
jgi:hypothetical protein